jgi:uncharacterized protein (TIGR02569 family)
MSAPPPGVLTAFGADAEAVLLDGGMGETWRAGDLVLKPVGDRDAHAWVCDLFDGWGDRAVRVPAPVRTARGDWSLDGWGAHVWLPGSTARAGDDPDRFRECVDAFHRAIAAVAPPTFLAGRTDAWAFGDRVAFDGVAPVGSPEVRALIARAATALRPVRTAPQLVHGDLGGNTLWADGLPPAVIDFSPYYRPSGWALAVVAMDAICWDGAAPDLLDRWADVDEWDQLLLRAVVFRLATRGRFEAEGAVRSGSDGYLDGRVGVDLVLDRIARAA